MPLELQLDLTGAQQRVEAGARRATPYKKGAYHKIVDTFYDDPWLKGIAHFVDGADVDFTVTDHVRASRRPSAARAARPRSRPRARRRPS